MLLISSFFRCYYSLYSVLNVEVNIVLYTNSFSNYNAITFIYNIINIPILFKIREIICYQYLIIIFVLIKNI